VLKASSVRKELPVLKALRDSKEPLVPQARRVFKVLQEMVLGFLVLLELQDHKEFRAQLEHRELKG
jgi:hypothetical protein